MTKRTKIYQINNFEEYRILRRLNRFVVEVTGLRGVKRAYFNNTGRLKDYLIEGKRAFCIPSKTKRTDCRLFAIEDVSNLAAIVDTHLQMSIFEKILEHCLLPWLRGWHLVKRNAQLKDSLIDYLLRSEEKQLYLEIKSAVLRKNNFALYPDCPSIRGRRHIEDLIEYAKNGGLGMILFIAALPKVQGFKPNKLADPELYDLLLKAYKIGIPIKAIGIDFNPRNSFIYLFNPDLKIYF